MTERDLHLIWMAGVSWDGMRGTDRHLVTAMAQYARILWVDPPVSPVTSARQRNISGRSFRPHISVIDNQVTRLSTVALPGLTRAGVRTTTALLVRRQVRWALNRLDIRPFAVVSTYLADVLGYWGRDVVNVLYGTDDYVAGATLMACICPLPASAGTSGRGPSRCGGRGFAAAGAPAVGSSRRRSGRYP